MPTTRVSESQALFQMEHLQQDLRRKSVRGAAATLLGQAGRFATQIIGMAVLARLLLPQDFGVVGKTVAITGLITMLQSGGLSLATVQRNEITHEQVSTLFWMNAALGLGAAALLAAVSPLIAWFYSDPRVMWLSLLLSGAIIIDGFSVQHAALLQRQMRFKALGSIGVTARVAGFVAAAVSAWMGAGYWALVVQQYGTSLANLVMVLWSCRWVPGPPRRGSGAAPMLRMGAHQTGFGVLNFFSRNIDNVLIGRYVSDIALGFYSQAYRLLLLPVQQINMPVSSVVVPALSRLQHQPERFVRFYYRALEAIAFVGMPVVSFLLIDARPLVVLALGEKWLPIVPIFRALGVAAFINTFNVAGGWLYTSLGRTGRQLRWQVLASLVTVGAFFIGLRWGALGVAISFSATRVVLLWPSLAYSCHGTPVNMRQSGRTLARPAFAALVALLVVWGIESASPTRPTVMILVDALAYGVTYLGTWMLMPGGRAHLRQLAGMVQELRPRRT